MRIRIYLEPTEMTVLDAKNSPSSGTTSAKMVSTLVKKRLQTVWTHVHNRILQSSSNSWVWSSSEVWVGEATTTIIWEAETRNDKNERHFKDKCKTKIAVDAGQTGIGAVLTQQYGTTWRVVSYASRSLTRVERSYSQTEKEALALVWACERIIIYIF